MEGLNDAIDLGLRDSRRLIIGILQEFYFYVATVIIQPYFEHAGSNFGIAILSNSGPED